MWVDPIIRNCNCLELTKTTVSSQIEKQFAVKGDSNSLANRESTDTNAFDSCTAHVNILESSRKHARLKAEADQDG